MKLHGSGFIVTPDEAKALGLAQSKDLDSHHPALPSTGRDLTDELAGSVVIDLFGFSDEEARRKLPGCLSACSDAVKPERDAQQSGELSCELVALRRAAKRDFAPGIDGPSRATLRPPRLLSIGSSSSSRPTSCPTTCSLSSPWTTRFILGVLSSRIHVAYALGGWRALVSEDRPVYNKSRCFDPFPFPACDAAAQERIRKIAEELDAHRKRVQSQHPGLTLTGMYNVLEKLRASEALEREGEADS